MHFPLFVEMEGLPCLVIGGGPVAVRKAAALAGCGAVVTVVAPRLDPAFAGLDGCRTVCRAFRPSDLEGQALVVSATDDAELNGTVSGLCRAKRIPVNVVDDPERCSFIFPAIVRKGPVVAAVSSGGTCPVAARLVRDKVGRILSDDLVAAVTRLGEQREELKRLYPDPQERKRVCEKELERWND